MYNLEHILQKDRTKKIRWYSAIFIVCFIILILISETAFQVLTGDQYDVVSTFEIQDSNFTNSVLQGKSHFVTIAGTDVIQTNLPKYQLQTRRNRNRSINKYYLLEIEPNKAIVFLWRERRDGTFPEEIQKGILRPLEQETAQNIRTFLRERMYSVEILPVYLDTSEYSPIAIYIYVFLVLFSSIAIIPHLYYSKNSSQHPIILEANRLHISEIKEYAKSEIIKAGYATITPDYVAYKGLWRIQIVFLSNIVQAYDYSSKFRKSNHHLRIHTRNGKVYTWPLYAKDVRRVLSIMKKYRPEIVTEKV